MPGLSNLARFESLEAGIMNPVRLMTMAALCREVVLPAGVVAWLAVFGSTHIEHTRARPIINHLAPALAANAEFAGKPKAIAPIAGRRWQPHPRKRSQSTSRM